MGRLLGLGLILVALSTPVLAGTISFNYGGTVETITTSANVDAGLTKLLAKENALRAARTPPDAALSLEQFLKAHFTNVLQSKRQEANTVESGDFCTVFPTLTTAQRNQITALGGGSSPCP